VAIGRQHPYVFIYLHNNSDRKLYCTLLGMTDRFRCHNRLFTGDRIPSRKDRPSRTKAGPLIYPCLRSAWTPAAKSMSGSN